MKSGGAPTSRHELYAIMENLHDAMAAHYDQLHQRALEDPGTAGDAAEEVWAQALRDWLPATYHVVTKGRLVGVDGATTPQLDILVLDSTYPRAFLDTKYYFAAVVESKIESRLEDAVVRANPHPALLPDLVWVADVATWTCSHTIMVPGHMLSDEVEEYGKKGGILTFYFSHSPRLNNREGRSVILGSLLTDLIERLAWRDPGLRGLAEYLQYTGVAGGGLARPLFDELDILPQPLVKRLRSKGLDEGEWSKWNRYC